MNKSEKGTSSQTATSSEHSVTLVHLPPPMRKRTFYLMLARAKQLQSEGNRVILTHCALKSGTCFSNIFGRTMICAACSYSTRKSVGTTGLPLIQLKAYSGAQSPSPSLTLTERKEIATGTHSAMTSIFRVLTKDLNRVPKLKKIKRYYYQTGTALLSAYNQELRRLSDKQVEVGHIEVPNGRVACTKFALTAARQHHIPYNTLDYNRAGRPMLYRGHSPHERQAIQARILSNPADSDFAEQWYAARRNHSGGKLMRLPLPATNSEYRKRVSVFLSSQDECESLGPDWRSVFKDNAAVVQIACDKNPDYHFCLRFHPNQAGILSDIFSRFRPLEHLQNLTIFYPTDSVDSYQLVQWSDVVVVFQSTIALEACWMGKPVIQLGPSFYDALDVAETPRTISEFLDLLRADLQPRSAEGAARFAHYATHDYDLLPHLKGERGKVRPIGFRRVGALLAKPAKELNTHMVKFLKRSIKGQLSSKEKAA